MKIIEYRLKPHQSPIQGKVIPAVKEIQSSCRLTISKNIIDIIFELKGKGFESLNFLDEEVAITKRQLSQRRDDLWRNTCFELFLGVQGRLEYFELNLAPGGHWNLYGFSDYRTGHCSLLSSPTTFFQRSDKATNYEIGTQLDLNSLSISKLNHGQINLYAMPAMVLAHSKNLNSKSNTKKKSELLGPQTPRGSPELSLISRN